MDRKRFWSSVAGALFVVLPTIAYGQFKQSDWELTLNGSGVSSDDFNSTGLTVGGGVGYFLTDQFEIGGRQTYTFNSIDGGGSSWAASTRAFVDFHFDLDRWQPFIGASAGYAYGDDVDDKWIAGLEAGVKYFVNATTFVYGTFGWDFDLQDSLDEGNWVYGVGIGFRF
jgi:hypothetical protein